MKNTILFLCMFCSISLSQELKVAFGFGKPPYVFKGKQSGIEIDLVKIIFRELGYGIKISFYQYDYLQTSVLKKRVDVAVGVAEKDDGLFYSNGLTMYKNAAIVKNSIGVKLKSFEHFKGFRVGAWKNASKNLGEDFKNSIMKKQYRYYEYPDQKDQNTAFWNNSIDIIIVDLSIFEWYRKKFNKSKNDYTSFSLFKPKYTKVSFSDEQLRDAFNAKLDEIKKSGKYDRIVRSYID